MTPPEGRVLVADDDRSVRTSVAEILASDGYSVVEAQDGIEGLERLSAGEVDAVVLDVKMPRCGGLEMLDQMVPRPPPPGVILVTAYDVGPEIRVRFADRIVRVLRKPVPPAALLAAVAEAIEISRGSQSA